MVEARVYRFGSFRLDVGARSLAHGGQRVALRGKAFDLLELLVRREGEVVDKAALLGALWPGIAVHENNIAVTARSLRKALHAHEPALEWIETVPGRGYRLGPGTARGDAIAPGSSGPSQTSCDALEPVHAPGADLFVARDAELARLDALWEAARGGSGQLVFVSGEPGIGKSALVAQFVSRALERVPRGVMLMRGQCIQLFGLAEPHLPWREALSDGLSGGARVELLEALERYAPGWCGRLPPALVGARVQREAWQGAHAGAHELSTALRAAGMSRPILLLLEDLHWADASSVDVLRWLSSRLEGSALLALATYRPADVRAARHPLAVLLADLAGRDRLIDLALDPWQRRDLERYLAARFESPALAAALGGPIERRGEGSPLISVRLCESLLSRGLVRRDAAGAWALALPLAALELRAPASVAALIESQIEQLPPGARRLLEVACVDGAEFGTAIAGEVLGVPLADVEAALEHLASAHALVERVAHPGSGPAPLLDQRYRFRHVLFRDHLYERLGSQRRIELHLAVARALVGSREAASPSRVAFHFERGRDLSRAVACWTEAGDAADRAFTKLEALECYERAAALLDALPAGERAMRRLVLEHGRGWAAYGLSRIEAARHHFAEFARLARELTAAPPGERDTALALAREYFGRPWSDVVMQRPAGIFPLAARADVGSELLAEALHCCCHIAHAEGRVEALHEHARDLERIAVRAQSAPRRAEALAWLGVHALLGGRAERARARLDAALALARELDHERALRVALGQRGWLHRMQAELDRAQGAYEELWRRVPDASSAADALSELGATLAARGRAGAALDAHRSADALRQRIDPGYPSLHGALLRELGQLGAARELDQTAIARLRGRAEPLLLGRLLASLALTSCRAGDLASASEPLREAEALMGGDHDCSWRLGPLWAARCELSAQCGDRAQLERVARRWSRSARARADAEGSKHAGRWLAVSSAQSGDVARGLAQLRLALDATRARPLPLVDWRCQALLAELALQLGERDVCARARTEAQQSIDSIAGSLHGAERSCFEQMVASEQRVAAVPSDRRLATPAP